MDIADTCDRCAAHAYTAWWNPTIRGLLVLCAHHATEHAHVLAAQGFELTIDDRAALQPA